MRLILSWIDQLRRTTVDQLPAFCSALVSQFEEIVAAANAWAANDHNSDGSHSVVRFKQTNEPSAPVGGLAVWWDGTNLKWKKPDGSTGNVV